MVWHFPMPKKLPSNGSDVLEFAQTIGYIYHNATDMYISNVKSGNLYLGTNNYSSRITIIPNGNVGIGTINPTKTLDVSGDINVVGGNIYKDGVIFTGSSGSGTGASVEKLNRVFHNESSTTITYTANANVVIEMTEFNLIKGLFFKVFSDKNVKVFKDALSLLNEDGVRDGIFGLIYSDLDIKKEIIDNFLEKNPRMTIFKVVNMNITDCMDNK